MVDGGSLDKQVEVMGERCLRLLMDPETLENLKIVINALLKLRQEMRRR
jgi:hypothetical protein